MRTFIFLIFISFLFWAQTARAVSLGVSPSAQVTQNGQTVTVDVTVTGYTDIVAFQFSMNWDPAVLQFQGLSNFMSDLSSSNFNTGISGGLTVVYASNTTLPASLPDGSTIFSIQFLAIGANGTSSNITFGSVPTPLKFYDSALVSLGVTTQSGLVSIAAQGDFSVSGNIHRASGPPIPNVTVDMTGDAIGSEVTAVPGDYLFDNILTGDDVTLTPSKDIDHLECVSVRDLIFINKHILGLMPLPSPYQMIEADVNKSNSITTFDAVEIRKLILGIYTQFPNNTSWRFVDADYVFPNSSNPFQSAFPESVNILDVQANVTQDFIGMKIGDATDCVNDSPAPAFLTLSASNASGMTGQQVNIDVSVQGFNDVLGLQFSMEWDPAVLQLDQVNPLNPASLSLAHIYTTNGKLSFCWNGDVSAGGVDVPDGTNIFSLQFTIVGVGSGVSPISFVQTPTKFEVVDKDCLPYSLNVNNGNVQWSGGGNAGLQLMASSATACTGDVVCVDVSVADFENMVAGQFSMNWDPAVLSFQQVQNFGLPGMATSNFNTLQVASGALSFAWVDPNASGVTLPDNSILFRVCFTVVGATGTSSPISFGSSHTVLEFVDINAQIPVTITNGSVAVGCGPSPVQIIASNKVICPGEPVCIQVTTADFENVLAGQFSMSWDPAVVSFQQVQGFGLPGMNAASFGTSQVASGVLSFFWFDPNAVGVTVPDGTVLFEVCFDAIGAQGSSTGFNFLSTPNPVEFIDASFNQMTSQLTNGLITINHINSLLICNDLINVMVDANCEATVTVNAVLESCTDDPTIYIYEMFSGPLIASGLHFVTFDASAYIGQLLIYEVNESGSGNSCWGNILITGDCQPSGNLCDSISSTAVRDTFNQDKCCYNLYINNQKPDFFSSIYVTVLSGGELHIPVGVPSDWSVQGYSSNYVYLVPDVGTIGVGVNDVAQFCLKNLTADVQVVEIEYYDLQYNVVCRDTLELSCDACVQAIVDSVYCDGWNHFNMDFCIKAGESLDWTIGSVSVHPVTSGISFDQSEFSVPDLMAGDTFCKFTVAVTGGVPGQEICFTAIVHHEDIAAGELDLSCCADTIPVCFILPGCDPCDSMVTFATAEQVFSPTDSCCWKITLHNPPDTYIGVGTEVITPGVVLDAVNNFVGSGWNLTNWTSTGIDLMPISPQGSFVQDSSMLPVVCFDGDVPGPWEMAVTWYAADSSECYDTLRFDCASIVEGSDCATFDSTSLVCNQDGTFSFTFTVKNYSSITADHIHLTPVGSFTVNPSEFYVPLLPGDVSPLLTATVTGSSSGGVFNFLISLHEINDDSLHLNCCTTPGAIPVQVDDAIGPTCSSPPNIVVECENFDPSLNYGTAIGADGCCFDTIVTAANYALFDSLCYRGTIVKSFTALDCAGNTAVCHQQIVVLYEQDYYIKFPNDVFLTTCNGTNDFGTPEIYGEDCELIGVSYEDHIITVAPDACYKIERTWTIINWCTYDPGQPCTVVPNPNPNASLNHPTNFPGPVVSEFGNTVSGWSPTVVSITPGASLTDYSIFWNANANCYQYTQIIKVIDSERPQVQCPASPVEICDYSNNDATLWNESYWSDPTHGTTDLCEGAVNLELTATDLCTNPGGLTFTYFLFLDLDGDGTMETVVNSANLPGYNNVQYNNAFNSGYSGGTPRAFDERFVPANEKWGFGLQVDAPAGTNQTARVQWLNQIGQNIPPQLPYGTHKIKWTVMDACGNETVCEYVFTVKDCDPPQISCIDGLSVSVMPTGMVMLWVTDFIQSAQDNCTPLPMLTYGIRISGTGSGFPTGQVSQIFTCAELGTQQMEVWVMDKAGNVDFCQTFVVIQDNLGICPPAPPSGGDVFRLYQNQPNPWSEHTVIGFYLPEAATATLTVFDAVGRTRYSASGEFKKGDNSFQLEHPATDKGGMLYYRVETPAASATMKMVQKK